MFNKCLLALVVSLTAGAAPAANTADDLFLKKVRFIRHHAPNPADYPSTTRQLIEAVNQSDGPMLAALGRAFMRLEDFENANGVLLAAVRITPSNAQAQADLAFVSAMQGIDCSTSRAAYSRALELNSDLADQPHVRRARELCPG